MEENRNEKTNEELTDEQTNEELTDEQVEQVAGGMNFLVS